MPKLDPYIAQNMAGGQARIASPVHQVDTSSVQQLEGTIGSQYLQLKAKQEAEAKRIQDDEARMAAANLSSRASATWSEKFEQAKTGATAGGAGFTDGVLKEFDSWKDEQLKAMPEAARRYGEREMLQFRQGLHADAFRYEVKARNDKLVSDFHAGADDDTKTVYAQPNQFPVVLARRLAAAESLALPPDVKQRVVDQTKETLALSAASALIERDPEGYLQRVGVRGAKVGKDGKPAPQDEVKAAEAIKRDPLLASLSPENLRQTVDRATMISETRKAAAAAEAERRARMAEMEAAKRDREATHAWTILSDWSAAGKVADESNPQVKQLIGKLQGTAYAPAFVELQKTAASGAAVASLPLPTQQAQLDTLMARRNQQGTSPALEHEIKLRESMLTQAKTEFGQDPMRAALERNMLGRNGLAPVDVSNLDTFEASIGPRLEQSKTVSIAAGKPVSPVTKDEAHILAGQLAALPPEQRALRVARLSQTLGPQQSQALASQINDKDRALSLAVAAGSSMTTGATNWFGTQTIAPRPVSTLIIKGQQALKDKTGKDTSEAPSKVREEVAKVLGDSLSGKAREDVLDAASLIYVGMQAEGQSPNYERAVSLAAGGPIIDHNGRKIPAPPGMTTDIMRDKLRAMKPTALAQQLPDGKVYAGGKAVETASFLTGLPDSTLEPAGLGRYFVRSGAGLATNSQGKPITIEVR